MVQVSIIGGLLIGLASLLLMLSLGRIAGISGIAYRALFSMRSETWTLYFVLGLVAGPVIMLGFTAVQVPDFTLGWLETLLGGLLVGIGTRLGSGCTSGHGVCGIGRGSMRSVIATLVFMVTGMLTVGLIGVVS